jgi:hypothetical protein
LLIQRREYDWTTAPFLKSRWFLVAVAVVVTQTVHAVAVAGHWRWILSPSRFAVYRSGTCPTAGPPSASA